VDNFLQKTDGPGIYAWLRIKATTNFVTNRGLQPIRNVYLYASFARDHPEKNGRTAPQGLPDAHVTVENVEFSTVTKYKDQPPAAGLLGVSESPRPPRAGPDRGARTRTPTASRYV
jgi:hypothetical protein